MRHGLPDAERIADGEHDVANLERVGIGEFKERQALAPVLDAQHGEIGALILEHQRCLELALVGERDLHFVGAFDDVVVGDDQAGGIHQHAGAERALQLAAAAAAARHAEEAPEDRIVEQRIAVLHHLGGVDIDHRRRHPLHHRRIGQAQLGRGRHAPLLGDGLLRGSFLGGAEPPKAIAASKTVVRKGLRRMDIRLPASGRDIGPRRV